MFGSFLAYFLRYIFVSRTRQRLLFLAVVGLVISSFALLVLQSTMGGLQEKLIGRSKEVLGEQLLQFSAAFENELEPLQKILKSKKINYLGEYEIEMLLRSGSFLSPALVHGVSKTWGTPSFIDENIEGVIVPYDIARQVRISVGEEVEFISPAHVDSFMGDIPRSLHVTVDDIISTDVPEVDSLHVWMRLGRVQNMVRAKKINRIRIFASITKDELKRLLKGTLPKNTRILSWEDQNTSLVYALRLETSVMVFLFIMMTVLVSLCITSGLLIFFNKVKVDLASFWVLGADKKTLFKYSSVLLFILSLVSVMIGLSLALFFLFILDRFGIEIMPAVFVDRKIPVHITLTGVYVSFLVPLFVSFLFGSLTLLHFRKSHNPMDQIRSIS